MLGTEASQQALTLGRVLILTLGELGPHCLIVHLWEIFKKSQWYKLGVLLSLSGTVRATG